MDLEDMKKKMKIIFFFRNFNMKTEKNNSKPNRPPKPEVQYLKKPEPRIEITWYRQIQGHNEFKNVKFKLYISTGSGFKCIYKGSSTRYEIKTLKGGQTYKFQLSAINGTEESDCSDIATVVLPPNIPLPQPKPKKSSESVNTQKNKKLPEEIKNDKIKQMIDYLEIAIQLNDESKMEKSLLNAKKLDTPTMELLKLMSNVEEILQYRKEERRKLYLEDKLKDALKSPENEEGLSNIINELTEYLDTITDTNEWVTRMKKDLKIAIQLYDIAIKKSNIRKNLETAIEDKNLQKINRNY